jgi:hypothetical protein
MEIIVTGFEAHIIKHEQATGHPQGKSKNVDERIAFIL